MTSSRSRPRRIVALLLLASFAATSARAMVAEVPRVTAGSGGTWGAFVGAAASPASQSLLRSLGLKDAAQLQSFARVMDRTALRPEAVVAVNRDPAAQAALITQAADAYAATVVARSATLTPASDHAALQAAQAEMEDLPVLVQLAPERREALEATRESVLDAARNALTDRVKEADGWRSPTDASEGFAGRPGEKAPSGAGRLVKPAPGSGARQAGVAAAEQVPTPAAEPSASSGGLFRRGWQRLFGRAASPEARPATPAPQVDDAFATARRLAELSGRIDALRHRMVYDVLLGKYDHDGSIRAEYDWTLGTHAVDAHQLTWILDSVNSKNGGKFDDAEFAALEREVQRLEGELDRGIAEKNSSVELIRQVAAARDLRRDSATGDAGRVHLYVSNQVANGVLGTAKLIAAGLVDADPKVEVDIFVLDGGNGSLFKSEDARIRVRSIGSRELAAKKLHLNARVHVNVSSRIEVKRDGDAVFYVNPQPNVQGDRKSADYFGGYANNNVKDPYGTLYFDRGRYRRRLASDAWSPETMELRRSQWLGRNVASSTWRLLKKLGERQGWDPVKSVWTWGYAQDTARFALEMDALAKRLRSGGDAAVPFAENGRQLLIHFVPGSYQPEQLQPAALAAMGIQVLVAGDDAVLAPPAGRRVPITVVLHGRIGNDAMAELQSELSGTLQVRDGVRTDFPAFMTGSGSWLEAVSAGAPVLHDNYDTSRNAKKSILLSTLIRFYALEKPEWSRDRVEKEAQARVNDYILGEGDHSALYADLHAWTLRSRRYSEAQFHFDLVDDVLAAARAARP